MQNGEIFLIGLVFAMLFFAWPRHRPVPRKIEPRRRERSRDQQ